MRLRNGQLIALLTTQSARENNDLRQSGLSSRQVDSDLQALQQILAQSPLLHAAEPLFQQSESELAQLRTTGYYNSGWLEHGTGTLGVVGGVENGYGVTGIAPQARIGAESIFQNQASYNIAGAILRAATVAGAGGVILIEVSSIGPQNSSACSCTSNSYSQCFALPEEYWQDRFDAIATATANGVTVVEAAGNGSCQLDHAVYGNAFNRTVRDSGAMMVGSSPSTSRTPIWYTNWGSRIDVHAWAENVVTTGGGHLFNGGGDPNQYYMDFSGTSSASAIVAGVATSVQGVKIASGAGALSPRRCASYW